MVVLPLALKLAIALSFAQLGRVQALRLHRVRAIGLDDALSAAPWLWSIALAALVDGGSPGCSL